jgi:methylated-DNA-[protein]-cysteine S-methyltransferase
MMTATVSAASKRTTATARPKAWVAMLPSPVGELRLVATDDGLADIVFPDSSGAAISPVPNGVSASIDDHPMLARAAAQLGEYFAGKRQRFTVKLAPRGTAFQHRVWGALAAIPYGETRSYAQIARAIGKPTAMRAVGAANGRNPLPIIVPCHRVIGANGTLTGFGGGLPTKQWLLDLERRHRG